MFKLRTERSCLPVQEMQCRGLLTLTRSEDSECVCECEKT